ncbi:DUF6005 family protein [uncultured Paracoccus sp.]|uniref:DUF6005 family protein n=1 Tax=uncultured Paracoccus sp. TaxID=189685 RepID=UPI0030D9F2D3|tara:strand:- start:1959 stop:3191 length:1233 start_codon:yes stop_codon:yes gene_type:complete
MTDPRPIPAPQDMQDRIRAILAGPMACPRMAAFGPEARLGHDLGLDSVALMTLMLHLDEAGITMAEDTFDRAPGMTVQALSMALAGVTPAPDEPVDIKVHCVVSCLCQALKDRGGIDHRPLYLGLWDGQVIVDDRMRLSYHAPGIDHGFYLYWAGRLFGLQVTRWHEDAAPGARNLDRLHALLADWRPGRYVMPMVDMALLPQRDNKFAQASFPHYALLEPTADPDTWLMRDPDFRWEGPLPARDLRAAFLAPTVAGGFAFDNAGAHPADDATIAAMHHATFDAQAVPLIDAIRRIVQAHVADLPRADLEPALRELPVIAIRKYAYEHALAIFGDIEGADHDAFEECCDRIAALHGGLNAAHLRAVAFARGGDGDDLLQVLADLDRLTLLEQGIKATVGQWFDRWQGARA